MSVVASTDPHNFWQVDKTQFPETSSHCHACFQQFREASGWVTSHWCDKKNCQTLHDPISFKILQLLDQVLPRSFPREVATSRRRVGRQENVLGLQVGVGHLAARKGGGHITSGICAKTINTRNANLCWINPLWRIDRCLSISWPARTETKNTCALPIT